MDKKITAKLILEDNLTLEGYSFGCKKNSAGEVVFNTGMVGYPESLTDPSYWGQILVFTYPLIGNYGVPCSIRDTHGLEMGFESSAIRVKGLVVSEYSEGLWHWQAEKSLSEWLSEHEIPAIYGIDTRMLTKHLRNKGTMLGKIIFEDIEAERGFYDPNTENLVKQVSIDKPVVYEGGEKRVVVIDCGCKNNIIRSLLNRGLTVIRVPWDYDFHGENFHGILISNGPGNPKMCDKTIRNVEIALEKRYPVFGICLGNQILALAAGGDTYKLKFGHRSQNQPCIETGTKRCFITSQNHGYAVDTRTLGEGWQPWFINANDGTNEGIKHRTYPFVSVQFHPEASPGPVDTGFLFDHFLEMLK